MNLKDELLKGVAVEKAERVIKEKARQHELHGGNAGYLVNGEIHGRCGREAIMRYFGVDKDFDFSTRIMFGAGEKMEDILINWLAKAGHKTLTQSEAGIKWDCEGIPVTGSPDIVIVDDNNVPTQGVEVKMVCSLWTARDVTPYSYITGKPKADHLCQAAHYMRKLGEQHGEDFIPWKITYICPVGYHAHTKDLRESSYNSEFLQRNDQGKVFKIRPFVESYNLVLDASGRLLYQLEGTEQWKSTEITIQGIEDYYKLLVDRIGERKLPPRAANTDCEGKPLRWDRYCEKYNDYVKLHDAYDGGSMTFDEFIAAAKEVK